MGRVLTGGSAKKKPPFNDNKLYSVRHYISITVFWAAGDIIQNPVLIRLVEKQKFMVGAPNMTGSCSSTVPRLNFLPLENLPVVAVAQLIEVVVEFCHDLRVWLAEALIKLRTVAAILWTDETCRFFAFLISARHAAVPYFFRFSGNPPRPGGCIKSEIGSFNTPT